MCLEHANTIDNPATLPAYPPERLKDWKTKQLKEYDRLNQGWALNDEMAREAIKESFSSVGIAISNSTVHLDGKVAKLRVQAVAAAVRLVLTQEVGTVAVVAR